MRFVVDAQLPPALARWLNGHGREAWHLSDVGLAGSDDRAVWDHALERGAILISKDEDFAQRKILEGGGPPVVWIRLPNTRKRQLIIWFATALPAIVDALERGETLIEVV